MSKKKEYEVIDRGVNSQGNSWDSRDYGPGQANDNTYHYSNQYIENKSNADGSKYYNDGQGGSRYDPPAQTTSSSDSGQVADSSEKNTEGVIDEAGGREVTGSSGAVGDADKSQSGQMFVEDTSDPSDGESDGEDGSQGYDYEDDYEDDYENEYGAYEDDVDEGYDIDDDHDAGNFNDEDDAGDDEDY